MSEPRSSLTTPDGSGSSLASSPETTADYLAQVLAQVPMAYLSIDRNWIITFANEKAAIANRLPLEDFVGKNLWERWPELIGSPLEGPYRRVMETRVPERFEYHHPPNYAWFDLHVVPIPQGIGIFYIETTQHHISAEALEESERRYHAFTELNPQMILMAGPDGSVTYANQRLLNYSGLTLEQTCGEGWRAAIHPDDKLRVVHSWADALQRGDEFDVETRIRRADGAYLWFWVRGLPVRNDAGQILYWLGVCIEIDERKSATEKLKQSQQETERQRRELETVYLTAPIGLALFDPVEFRYLRLNARQAEIVGLPMEQILGKTLTEIAPIEGLREMFEQVAQGRPIQNQLLEGELPMQPGVHRYWTVNYYPVYDPDGKIQAITAASLEITNQKRAESAVIQSEKLAAVGRLASSISHEINNPLEAVTNLLYLAVSHPDLPEDARTYLRTAQAELARVSQISTQALRFHRQTMSPTPVSPAELMNSVLDLYHGRLKNSNIQAHTRYRSTARILCFENDIRQVLTNLIANAFDAMRQGGRLLLRTRAGTHPVTGGKGVWLTIADTGHGISPETKKHLFEAFYTTKDLNGTGLGLWISRGIIERHHGRLTFRSSVRPGRSGTVFTIFLPDGLSHKQASPGSTASQ